jgi:hypothetical protein
MIEVDFKDRIPTHAGRVKLTPVSGQPDTFTMERADEPTEPGTPIDKAAFDSIIKSRLTGRFYAPTTAREAEATATATVNLIPSSGWTNESTTYAKNGNYIATAISSEDNTISPAFAFDGTTSMWEPASGNPSPWIAMDLGESVRVTRIKTYYTATYDSVTCKIQGSNDEKTWITLSEKTGKQTAATNWSFTNTTAYRYYRLLFGNGVGVRVYSWEFTSYTVTTYRNVFLVSTGFPVEWTKGQRVLIELPSSVNTLGVVKNTLNGVTVNTILQPSRRYELTYNGTAFDAKEV